MSLVNDKQGYASPWKCLIFLIGILLAMVAFVILAIPIMLYYGYYFQEWAYGALQPWAEYWKIR